MHRIMVLAVFSTSSKKKSPLDFYWTVIDFNQNSTCFAGEPLMQQCSSSLKLSKRILKSSNLCVSSQLDIAPLACRYFHFRKVGVKFCHCYFPNPLRANDYASSATDSIRYVATLNEIKEFCSFIEKCSQKQQIHFSTKAKY